ncbi:hypothetical protein BT93_B2444 [Corymbia citriodora subsp. variegata]|nr:hypothetical protein BT93_B2444 [Corymbia citriodora subsp. variegata]
MLKLSLEHNKSRTHNISYDEEPLEKKHLHKLRRLVVYLICSYSTQVAITNIHYTSKLL